MNAQAESGVGRLLPDADFTTGQVLMDFTGEDAHLSGRLEVLLPTSYAPIQTGRSRTQRPACGQTVRQAEHRPRPGIVLTPQR
ncbi:MAG: hypothetical protein ABJA82_19185 [Myxococcales bacterium]